MISHQLFGLDFANHLLTRLTVTSPILPSAKLWNSPQLLVSHPIELVRCRALRFPSIWLKS